MSSKKKTSTSPGTNPQTLKIGSRVRCTDDGVEGRIVWANAVSVKIQWDDGEQVTWRRDSLAERPIEILEAADEDQQGSMFPSETPVADLPVEPPATAPATAEQTVEQPPAEPTPAEPAEVPVAPPIANVQAEQASPPEPVQEAQTPPEPTAAQPEAPSAAAKQKRTPKKGVVNGKVKKLSAIDAAAKLLGETGTPMGCKELIESMAAKGYWTSPGGKTPAATLYSAILREITTKGSGSRFMKAERGKFTRNGAV